MSYNSLLESSDGGKQWTRVPGPLGGVKVSAFLGMANRLLVGSDKGLFQSDDNGKAWKLLEGPFGRQKVRALARVGENGLALVTASGIFVSLDGTKWKTTAPIPNEAAVYTVADAGGSRLIAGTAAGLIRSDDFGASWEPVYWGLGSSSVSAVCQHPGRPGAVFVAQYGMVYESVDGGASWVAVSSGQTSIGSIKGLAILPGSPDRLLALTQSQGIFALPLQTASGGVSTSTALSGRTGKTTTAR
jgi:photosystem II stability/assembly factor-like uncharacterized protein